MTIFAKTSPLLPPMKVLIIEDNLELSKMISDALRSQRFVVEVAYSYAEAVAKVGVYNYDCILLDVMLPDGSGLNVLRDLKSMNKSENVIILSANDSIDDKITGFDLGADDYLAKPFHMSELVARIRSVLRRNTNSGKLTIDLGNVSLDPDKFGVSINGECVELVKKEYDILRYMMERPDTLITKELLAEAVWGDHIDQVDNFDFIYTQLKNLRNTLVKSGATVSIKTIYGFGYKITEER